MVMDFAKSSTHPTDPFLGIDRLACFAQPFHRQLFKPGTLLYRAPQPGGMEEMMSTIFARLFATLLGLLVLGEVAAAQSKVTIAVGGGACLCYLPTVLAKQLGEYDKAGIAAELVDLK